MEFPELRSYIESQNISSPHVLKNCDLVIDGDSYFGDTYKASGCQFILGPDCDRYADFIINKLSSFLTNNIKCYVIFSGATKYEIDKRKEIHQSIIDKRNCSEEDLRNVEYFEPLFVKDVQKQVLEEMDIKYFVCEYDSTEAIIDVAKKFKCSVLTNNIEYSLFRVSCIPVNSVHEKNDEQLICSIYDHNNVRDAFGVYDKDKMSILLSLFYASGDHRLLQNLKEIIKWEQRDAIMPVILWIKREREASLISTISNSFDNENQNNAFKEVHERIRSLYLYPSCKLAVKYFNKDKPHSLYRKKWFAKGVSDGRIGPPYINLKKKGFVCGSLIMNDSTRPDALLAAFQIIAYGHCLLTNSQSSTITFLGRKFTSCSIREISSEWGREISNKDIFTKHRVGKKLKLVTGEPDTYQMFLEEVLPGYKRPLQTVPEECWVLIITLVYYIHKKNQNFINGAYCVLLSYIMLGSVSKKLKPQQQSLSVVSNEEKRCLTFYNKLQFLFNKVDLKNNYDSTIVHNFSEFQHCLQHMNYLNKLCGEKIPCTVYQDTYNATFIYNTLLFMKDKDHLMSFLDNNFNGFSSLEKYKNIVTGFENCLSAVKVG